MLCKGVAVGVRNLKSSLVGVGVTVGKTNGRAVAVGLGAAVAVGNTCIFTEVHPAKSNAMITRSMLRIYSKPSAVT